MQKSSLSSTDTHIDVSVGIVDESLDLCIEDILCADIVSDTYGGLAFQEMASSNSSFDPTKHEFIFESEVTYYCGRGRAFLVPNSDGVTQEKQGLACDWTGAWRNIEGWEPFDQLMKCTCKIDFLHFKYTSLNNCIFSYSLSDTTGSTRCL